MLMLPSAATQAPVGFLPSARVLMLGGEGADGQRLSELLARRGYELHPAAALTPGMALDAFDILVLARPAAAALAEIGELRARSGQPILVLQARACSNAAADALEAGADDCLAAPYNPHEVAARIRALLRRRDRARTRASARHVTFDGFVLDPTRRRIEGPDGRSVSLTNAQYRLLAALLARPREVVSRDYLLDQVHGEDSECFDRAIDVHVSRLKKRLGQITRAELISCYRGIGYRLDVDQVRH